MNEISLFCDFTKSDDEQRIVEGVFSTEALDVQGENVSRDAIANALDEYMKFGNIREMHQPSAVGKAISVEEKEHGVWYIMAKVVDDNAWKKVKEAVYNGFSIGGKKLSKIGDTITGLRLAEISLVDRPANPEAVFSIWKGDIMAEEAKEIEKGGNALDLLKSYMGEEVWDAQRALYALDAVMSLLHGEMLEDKNMPEQVAALRAAVKNIKAFIVSEIQEDNGSGEGDQTIEMSDTDIDIEKAGASISKTNKAKLQSIMEMCKEMMGDSEEEGEPEESKKSEEAADIEKADDVKKDDDGFDIRKAFEEQSAQIAKMADRIKQLEGMPAPAKGVTMAIAKGMDSVTAVEEPKTAFDLIKAEHAKFNKGVL